MVSTGKKKQVRIALVVLQVAVLAALVSMVFLSHAHATSMSVRITGGMEAAAGSWPSIVALSKHTSRNSKGQAVSIPGWEGPFCAGTLLAPRSIVTAAHCTEGINPGQYDAILGRTNLRDKSRGQRVAIVGEVAHPQYEKKTYKNDIALLRLAKMLKTP